MVSDWMRIIYKTETPPEAVGTVLVIDEDAVVWCTRYLALEFSFFPTYTRIGIFVYYVIQWKLFSTSNYSYKDIWKFFFSFVLFPKSKRSSKPVWLLLNMNLLYEVRNRFNIILTKLLQSYHLNLLCTFISN